MLIDSTTDSEESVQFKQRRIDSGVGYLVVVVAVLLFFLLMMVGLKWVQSISEQAVTVRPESPEPRSAEIGDSTAPGSRPAE